MHTRPLLTVEEKIQFAKVALGTSVSEDFFKSMDLTDDTPATCQRNPSCDEPTSSESAEANNELNANSTSERCDVLAFSHSLRQELNRIVDIIETHPTSVTSSFLKKKTARKIKFIKTPSQVLIFFGQKLMAMKTKTIRVQPASISRRKARGISKGGKRIQSGRPSTIEVGNAKGRKREHNLALNIKKNRPNAKLH